MALHKSTTSLLKESLPEFLQVAEYCIGFQKGNGGCLGYPGAAMMFSIADSLGSYHRNLSNFIVRVDGKNKSIKTDGYHHFFILNSEFYGLELSEITIKKLYENYRNLLLHNTALAPDHIMFIDELNAAPFVSGDLGVHVNVVAFLRVTKSAVAAFLRKIDQVVPGSDQERLISLKR
jgi:hypothetical protein